MSLWLIEYLYYSILFFQLEPLPEDIVHQIPNMNAIASLKKTTEIQSMFLNLNWWVSGLGVIFYY